MKQLPPSLKIYVYAMKNYAEKLSEQFKIVI